MFTFEVTRTKPFAPPELEGEYKLTIKGRKMKMSKVDDGIKARVTCNKTDDWNLVDGINTCLNRIQSKKKNADKIKVGDKVEVVNSKCKYPNYVECVVKNVWDKKDVACFANGSTDNLSGKNGFVVAATPHGDIDEDIAYVQFDIGGLKKI